MGAVTGIHHLCVNTPDIEKSVRFYREFFGFQLLDRETCSFGEYAMLRLGTSNLELIQPNEASDSFGRRGALSHFGLQVEKIDEVFSDLKNKGIRFVSEAIEECDAPLGGLRVVSTTSSARSRR